MLKILLIEVIDTITKDVQAIKRVLHSELIEVLQSTLVQKRIVIVVQNSASCLAFSNKLIDLFPVSLIIDGF